MRLNAIKTKNASIVVSSRNVENDEKKPCIYQNENPFFIDSIYNTQPSVLH
jgi:hypothetical protein